ncbi:MAG TPA: hypothetical protein P5234_02760 [Thermoanaerobaculaceae bacterium]|nr:hypothetical protein [Thermoanaerobaculaceae bacterium]HRS15149.1 hypothetical protein [Thermoanaerobaculaceae bacterium]
MTTGVPAALVLVASLAGAAPPPVGPGRGDAELVARLQQEGHVATAVPEPGVRDWVAAFATQSGRRLFSLLPAMPWLRSERLWQGVGHVALAVAILAFVWLAWSGLQRLSARPPRSPDFDVSAVPQGLVPRRGAAAWKAAAEEELAAGRARAALGALWWWVAESLLSGRAELSWTSRQLVSEARRPDLRPALDALDGLLYGPGEAGVEQVRTLARELAERVT